jgi:hypothetical protein
MTFAVSLGNVTRLCLDLGITAWIAWLVGSAVDLSVVGLLKGTRFLSLHGYTGTQLRKLQRMLRFCGLLTLALNTEGAIGHRQFGTALVDAVGPALLIGWSEVGPCMLRQIHAVAPLAAPGRSEAPPRAEQRPVLPAGCWPEPGNSTPNTAWQPAGQFPGTPSALNCGSAATGLAFWSLPSVPRQRRRSEHRCSKRPSRPSRAGRGILPVSPLSGTVSYRRLR